MIIAFVGGTGPEGRGLAYRFALAGHGLLIGSRRRERAEETARDIVERVPGVRVLGSENATAARDGELVVLTVPYPAQDETLPSLREAVTNKIVISTAVPMSFEGGRASMIPVPEGSAAEQVQALIPTARVVSAFQNLSAPKLWKDDLELGQDVIVCSSDAGAKREVMSLAEQVRGVRAIDGGLLEASRYVEGITVLLVGINRTYKTLAGVRITAV